MKDSLVWKLVVNGDFTFQDRWALYYTFLFFFPAWFRYFVVLVAYLLTIHILLIMRLGPSPAYLFLSFKKKKAITKPWNWSFLAHNLIILAAIRALMYKKLIPLFLLLLISWHFQKGWPQLQEGLVLPQVVPLSLTWAWSTYQVWR